MLDGIAYESSRPTHMWSVREPQSIIHAAEKAAAAGSFTSAEKLLREVGCPKINLQVRRSNGVAIAFYERLGFALDEVVSLGKRLEHD